MNPPNHTPGLHFRDSEDGCRKVGLFLRTLVLGSRACSSRLTVSLSHFSTCVIYEQTKTHIFSWHRRSVGKTQFDNHMLVELLLLVSRFLHYFIFYPPPSPFPNHSSLRPILLSCRTLMKHTDMHTVIPPEGRGLVIEILELSQGDIATTVRVQQPKHHPAIVYVCASHKRMHG